MLLLAPACGNLLDPAAAVVYGSKISVRAIDKAIDELENSAAFRSLARQGDPQAIKHDFEQTYLSQLIRRKVLEPKAEELGIGVTDEDVQARIKEIRADFPSQNAFEEYLREQGLTVELIERIIYDQELEGRLRPEVTESVRPTDEEVESYYRENIDEFRQTEAQHILVDNERLARRITDRLKGVRRKRVDELFARLAREFSIDQSNANDAGRLGFFAPGDFVRPFEQAADELELGEVSDPVQTDFGWHVIRVTDRKVQSFDEVRERLTEQLGDEERDLFWNKYVRDAYEEADVEVNPRYGEFDIETGRVVDANAEDIPGAEIDSESTPAPSPTG